MKLLHRTPAPAVERVAGDDYDHLVAHARADARWQGQRLTAEILVKGLSEYHGENPVPLPLGVIPADEDE